MRYAVHAYAWTSSWSNADLGLIDHAASLGFDAIEVPLMELDAVDPGAIRDRTERVGIEVLTSVVCPEDADPSSEDERVRDGGRDFLTRCVDATADSVVYPGMADRLRTEELSLALLPINGALGNMSGPEAARLAHAIGARLAVPSHYDMFEPSGIRGRVPTSRPAVRGPAGRSAAGDPHGRVVGVADPREARASRPGAPRGSRRSGADGPAA